MCVCVCVCLCVCVCVCVCLSHSILFLDNTMLITRLPVNDEMFSIVYDDTLCIHVDK